MKKIIKSIGALCLSAAVLFGCGTQDVPRDESEDIEKVSIVCTTFPQYDWVKNLLGDTLSETELTLLVKNSADVHNYQPSAQDMIQMKEADLFLYIGGESDTWAVDLMKADSALEEKALNLSEVLEADGRILCKEHHHEHDHDEKQEHAEEESYDEHIWLSLKNAEFLCESISEHLCEILPEHAQEIQKNTAEYVAQLQALDGAYAQMVQESAKEPLIFGDRFPFCYMTTDYDLEYYAAYTGCNAEIEVGFDTIIALADKVDVLESAYIMVIDGSDRSIAKTILDTAKYKETEILELNSIQSVSWQDVESGVSYLEIMEDNMEVLKKALNG